jgi:hypothetical protein
MTKGTTSNVKQKKSTASQQASELQQVDGAELEAKLDECLCQATGIQSPKVVHQIWSQMVRMQVSGEDLLSRYIAAFHMIAELKPANATEALLTVHMVGIHEAALAFLKRAMH